ncbi:nickel/cobalt transporter [Halomonas sp. V046]|uniref:nickel/cobalt transporter n=1 Tax=Halomonas sp. V046 TaxID=3459611 RepID=UPI004044AA37
MGGAHKSSNAALWWLSLLALGVAAIAWLVGAGDGGLGAVGRWIFTTQRDLHHALTDAVTSLDRAPSLPAWWTLLALSFGYGVFHAAGPGHGKAVLSTYLVSQGGAWRQALALSCAAALLQGLVAVLLVLALVEGLGWMTREALGSVVWVERLSFALVTVLGLGLCLRACRDLLRLRRSTAPAGASVLASAPPLGQPGATGHGRVEDAFDARQPEPVFTSFAAVTAATTTPFPAVGHAPGAACCSGHHHLTPHAIEGRRSALLAVLAIGARPCSGAVLLMGVTALLGRPWMGVVAVLCMSLGTALTVSLLGLASVLARGWAERRLAAAPSPSRLAWVAPLVALAGGVVIAALGVMLSLQVDEGAGSLPLLMRPAGTGLTGP